MSEFELTQIFGIAKKMAQAKILGKNFYIS